MSIVSLRMLQNCATVIVFNGFGIKCFNMAFILGVAESFLSSKDRILFDVLGPGNVLQKPQKSSKITKLK